VAQHVEGSGRHILEHMRAAGRGARKPGPESTKGRRSASATPHQQGTRT
jgi:hypothetical protein